MKKVKEAYSLDIFVSLISMPVFTLIAAIENSRFLLELASHLFLFKKK